MTHWSDAGFGTDPEDDARRRAELEIARLDPAAIRAAHEAIEDRILDRLHPVTGEILPSPAELEARILAGIRVPPPLGEVLTSEPDPSGARVCRSCGHPFSPTHDASAPGPNVRHPYNPSDEEVLDSVEHPTPGVAAVVALLAGQEPVEDAHAITRTPYPWGVAWVCACGRWEGVATGPRSAAWCEADYGRHRADEDAAARE